MEISESAWAKAREIYGAEIPGIECSLYSIINTHHTQYVQEAIASAIILERRECAEIAQDQYDFHMTVDGDNRAAAAADLISQAIRNK